MKKSVQDQTMRAVKSQSGFSLMEILIALALMSVALGFVATNFFAQFEQGKKDAAGIQLKNLQSILRDYRRDCNRYPTTEQGLDALLDKPTVGKECKRYRPGGYMQEGTTEIPLDPWDSEYIYESDGKTITLYSVGKDEEEGTEDDIHLNKKKK